MKTLFIQGNLPKRVKKKENSWWLSHDPLLPAPPSSPWQKLHSDRYGQENGALSRDGLPIKRQQYLTGIPAFLQFPVEEANFLVSGDNKLKTSFRYTDPIHTVGALSHMTQMRGLGPWSPSSQIACGVEIPHQEIQAKKTRGYHSHPVPRVWWRRDFLRGRGSP